MCCVDAVVSYRCVVDQPQHFPGRVAARMTPPKALKLRAEVEIHSVSCPGVFFPCKGPVHLSICFLGFHVKTKPFPPSFPLLFHDRCRP